MITQEEIENEALSYSNDYYNKFNCHSTANGFIAGSQWMQEQYQQALDSAPKWVKASDKLPGEKVICRWHVDKRIQTSFQDDDFLGRMVKQYNSEIEWLYEPKTETDGK